MITILDQEEDTVPEKIHCIFQASYAVEAELLGAKDFPPLKRTIIDFKNSDTSFFGHWIGKELTAVIEIEPSPSAFHISSLVVHPKYFRRGIASELIAFIFRLFIGNKITVETGLANIPAIALYKSFDFKEIDQYDTDHGIRKIRLAIEKATLNTES
ncbi:MAG: GNAT superfamily N-acetyltransferase [Sediminicola sp.]|jgi:GNAT superfamily N-acetyltransferase